VFDYGDIKDMNYIYDWDNFVLLITDDYGLDIILISIKSYTGACLSGTALGVPLNNGEILT
jgi:hypothetical protein